jgi:hypothetical protein
MRLLTSLILALSFAVPSRAQQAPALAKELAPLAFFLGEWRGIGAFASGRAIEADVAFASDLDGKGIVYRHTDRLPNTFKSLSIWSYNVELLQFLAVMSDNFGGGRVLLSSGWQVSKLTFEQLPLATQGTAFKQRFIFEKQTESTFKMTYERDKGDGKGWQMGDYLLFTRK